MQITERILTYGICFDFIRKRTFSRLAEEEEEAVSIEFIKRQDTFSG